MQCRRDLASKKIKEY